MSAFEILPWDKGEGNLPQMGVLGASRIVEQAVLVPSQGLFHVAAVAARDLSRAEAFARRLGLGRAYGDYQDLINDPEIDVVYVALPCSEHAKWSERALKAGKHVLCEKPFSLDVAEARSAVAVASQQRRLLMEAHHWRYHALVSKAEEALKRIGALQSIHAEFAAGLNNPGDIRLNPLLGAGATMDFGCYLIQWSLWAASASSGDSPLQAEVQKSKMIETSPGSGIDLVASIELSLGSVQAKLEADMRDGTPFHAQIRAVGSEGTLLFVNPLGTDGSYLELESKGGGAVERTPCPAGSSTYGMQMRALCSSLRTGVAPITSGTLIETTQSLLDACYVRAGLPRRSELRERHLKTGLV